MNVVVLDPVQWELLDAGAQDGDSVTIGSVTFEFEASSAGD